MKVVATVALFSYYPFEVFIFISNVLTKYSFCFQLSFLSTGDDLFERLEEFRVHPLPPHDAIVQPS